MNYLEGKAVLLVDDEPSVRDAIALLLGCLGGVVTEAGTGDEAMALFAPNRFALVVTDYTMPGMNGAALAEAIRQLDPGQRIIMISGYAEQLRRAGQLPPSIGVLLPKPCSLAALTEGLRAVGFSNGAGSPAAQA
jgi:CheY-like chemotaxis protein